MKIDSINAAVKLNNGIQMPWLGLGTYQSPPGETAENSVLWALEAGYRHIDTAALYKNEQDVGKAIRASKIPREKVFVTTKVWNPDIRAGKTAQALDDSLKKLGTDYVDLYLIHWPVPGKYVECWQVMEDLYKKGKAKSIGISNFLIHHIEDVLKIARVVPAVNQVEWHPEARQQKLVDFCQAKGIVFEAWAPLMQGAVAKIPTLIDIAKKHGKTPAQIAIRWGLQHQVVMIPKSVRKERIIENTDVFDFQLTADEMKRIDALDKNKRIGPDPDNFNF
jgi:diketogulonate reductase-like aldo/keto reductase